MAEGPKQKPVSAIEPVLLFIGVAGFVCIAAHALVTGWFWIPGSRSGGGGGYWASRTDDLNGYLTYLVIISAAAAGFMAIAIARLHRFNDQAARRRGR